MKRTTQFAFATVAVAAAFVPVLWPGSTAGFWQGNRAHAAPATLNSTATPGLPPAQSPASPDQSPLVKRGEYLARAGDCVACHTTRGGKPLAGGYALPTPFGTLHTPNLTPDKETGIGDWTADDFYRAMHSGKDKNGDFLYPAFPFTFYTKVTRADSDAIFAYLKSLPPIHQQNRENDMPFPFNQRKVLFGWRIMFFREGEFKPDPKQSAEWNRGAYLVEGLGHCAMCHTPINPLGASESSKAFAGGLIPLQNWYAPSLTSAKEGLGDWDLTNIADFLKIGVSERGAVYGPMSEVVHNSLQYMSDADIHAMSLYLKSLPEKGRAPNVMQIEPSEQQAEQLFKQGQKIYTAQCATCHAENGKGHPPAYPPLANNQSILMQSVVNPVRMVLNGGYPPATSGNPRPYGMPPFAQALSDQEVAAVVTYVRKAWGNNATAAAPQQVSDLRSAPLD